MAKNKKKDAITSELDIIIKNNKSSSDVDVFCDENKISSSDDNIENNEDNKLKKKIKKSRKELEKENEKVYEKKTFKQKMKALSVLLLLGVFTGSGLGVWYFNTALRSNVDYGALKAEDYVQDIDETLKNNFGISPDDKENFVSIAKSQGKTPADLTVADNFVLAEYNSTLATSYTAIGRGSVLTMGITQGIYSAKKFDGKTYTFESISSGLVSVASCDVFVKGSNKILNYNGGTENGGWKYATNNDLTTDDYLDAVGNLPNVLSPYIISDKTIIETSEMTFDEEKGHYSFIIKLDTVTSVLRYIKQVKKFGGLNTFPEFNDITQTITIDSDWNLVSIDVVEHYRAVAYGMNASCTGTLYTEYTFNGDVTLPV